MPKRLSIIPQYLAESGYKAYAFGKWHLGFCKDAYLPTSRGFDEFVGFMGGAQNYYTSINISYTVEDYILVRTGKCYL